MFTVAGLSSALTTLALGARWPIVFWTATGAIFAATLLTADGALRFAGFPLGPSPFWRRLVAGTLVIIAYLCGVFAFVAVAAMFGRPSHFGGTWEAVRDVCGLSMAGIVAAFGVYCALRIVTKTRRLILAQLVLIALVAAILSGSSVAWGHKYLIVKRHLFISPFWVTLLVIEETGFAWVWGMASLVSRHDTTP